ncbi:MAG: M20/M25/M40 family metallo-hydrolase, partial [Pseudomonadota bacterium]
MREELKAAIADRKADLVALTIDLIRFPTVNPPGDAYRPCAEFIARRLANSGFETRFIVAEGEPGHTDKYPRVNVVGRREGKRSGPTVHFNSHIDVVEAGLGWTYPPFEGVVKDGKVFGRGACDMKGGLATSIIAVEAFLTIFSDYPGTIEISGTVDEESGGYGGVAYLAKKGLFS